MIPAPVSATRASGAKFGWGPLVGFAIVIVATWSILHAGFHPEDFGTLAVVRRIDSPWSLVTGNIPFVYSYRPVPLLFWWLSVKLFDTTAIWHNVADMLIHGCNAALVGVLATRLTRQRAPGLIAAALFAALPAATATAAWMADRYDTIALLFSLLALLALEKAIAKRGSPWIVALLLLLALLSKEIAYAVAAIMLVQLIVLRPWRDKMLIVLFGAIAGSVALGLVLRLIKVAPLDTSLNTKDAVHAFWTGTLAWWSQSIAALNGFQPASTIFIAAIAILIVIAIVAVARDVWRGRVGEFALVIISVGLLVLPALVQWPVTQYALSSDENLAFLENLRFYYFAAAGLALLVAAGYARLRTGWARILMTGVCAFALVCGIGLSRRVSAQWASSWRPASRVGLALGRDLSARAFPDGCRIYLESEKWPFAFQKHVDTIVKAVADPAASVQGCAIFAGALVSQTLVTNKTCDAAHWPGLVVREHDGIPLGGSIGNLCLLPFASWKADELGEPLFRFHVDADGHLRAAQ